MKVELVAFCVLGFVYAGALDAQTVYHCTDKNGNAVFSTDPCGKDAKAKDYGNAPAKKSADTVQAGDAPVVQAQQALPPKRTRTAQDDISDSVADSNCRRSAQRLDVEPSTENIDRLRSEMITLQHRTWTVEQTRPTLQAQYDVNALAQQDQQHIATLQQTIATEELRNDQVRAESRRVVTDALAACDKAKADREKQ